jgi:hypothetical protein
MTSSFYKKLLFIIGLAGVLFSGYLSGVKYFTSVCAFNEPCPYFLGYPACWYGLGMFLTIFVISVLGIFKIVSNKSEILIAKLISSIGIIFAGYFTIPEIGKLFSGEHLDYTLILPTCAYGLIFYILIFALSVSVSRE